MKSSNQTREGMGYEFFVLLPIIPSLYASREQQAARFLNRFDAAANAPDTPSQCNDERACHRRIIKQGERERQRGTAHSKDRERVRAVPFSRMGSRGTSSCMHACMHLPPAGMYACMHLEEAADLKGIGCVIAVL